MGNIEHIKSTLGFEGLTLSPKVESLLKDFDNDKINKSELMKNIILSTQKQLNNM